MAMHYITKFNDKVTLEFDKNKDDRQPEKEYAYCQLYKNGRRVEQVRLFSYIDFSHCEHRVTENEAETIIQYCEINRSMLERENLL